MFAGALQPRRRVPVPAYSGWRGHGQPGRAGPREGRVRSKAELVLSVARPGGCWMCVLFVLFLCLWLPLSLALSLSPSFPLSHLDLSISLFSFLSVSVFLSLLLSLSLSLSMCVSVRV
jgi:hypothetical protein